jgi:hypothetical protein
VHSSSTGINKSSYYTTNSNNNGFDVVVHMVAGEKKGVDLE